MFKCLSTSYSPTLSNAKNEIKNKDVPALKMSTVRGGQKIINIIVLSTDYDYNPVILMKFILKMNSNQEILSELFSLSLEEKSLLKIEAAVKGDL